MNEKLADKQKSIIYEVYERLIGLWLYVDSFEGISRTFTDMETLHESEMNIVAKAKRYGR